MACLGVPLFFFGCGNCRNVVGNSKQSVDEAQDPSYR